MVKTAIIVLILLIILKFYLDYDIPATPNN